MRLLQGSWGEILTLTLIYQSLEYANKQNVKSLEAGSKCRTNSFNQSANMSSHNQNSSQVI